MGAERQRGRAAPVHFSGGQTGARRDAGVQAPGVAAICACVDTLTTVSCRLSPSRSCQLMVWPIDSPISAAPIGLTTEKRCRLGSASPGHTSSIVRVLRSEEHTSELQSLMRISYAVFCLQKKNNHNTHKKHLTPYIQQIIK